MTMKNVAFACLSLAVSAGALAGGLSVSTALAGDKPKLGGACKSDIKTLCADAGKGGARAKCLRDNEAKLSPDCAKAVAAMPANWGRKGAKDKAGAADDAGAEQAN